VAGPVVDELEAIVELVVELVVEPEVELPEVELPEVELPEVELPEVNGDAGSGISSMSSSKPPFMFFSRALRR
jgi:hypothetical protein